MFSFELECAAEDQDLVVAELWEWGSAGIVEGDQSAGRAKLRAFFDVVAPELLAHFADYKPRPVEEPDRDWVGMVRHSWASRLVGSRFFVVPEWLTDPTPPGRLRIEINPGLAFGTGGHESTRLCLAALERYVQPGTSVLDVGTGAGILAIASHLLGAGRVFACDVDPLAIEVAAGRCARVGTNIDLFVGSADTVSTGSVDLIAANITAPVLLSIAGGLLRVVRPSGTILVSGFETQEAAQVRAAFGRTESEKLEENSWCLLAFTQKPGPPG
jgi:ribosomal protein L11 methyltransferase